MGKSSKTAAPNKTGKPAKPRHDWPLYPHGNGRWAKKVLCKRYYFGRWDDPDGALAEWLRVKDYLLAGKSPPPRDTRTDTRLTLDDLVNELLHAKRQRVDSGELSLLSWTQYAGVCRRLVKLLHATPESRI